MASVSAGTSSLHIAMIPWLAYGHILPYLELAKRLARKGIRISFISTPKNITTILTKHLALSPPAAINFVSIPFPAPGHPGLNGAESTSGVTPATQYLLKLAFHSLHDQVATFLERSKPDFILYDFNCDWMLRIGSEIGVPCAFFSIFIASALAFVGPPGAFLSGDVETIARDLAKTPDWIPFETCVRFYPHEIPRFLVNQAADDPNERARLGRSIAGADFVAVRTSFELESKWIDLLTKLYLKPVIPVGVLFPAAEDGGAIPEWSGPAVRIKEWLDAQRVDSVLYVALGSEAVLSRDELTELAHGLEDAGLPFLWALRDLPESPQLELLPEGFQERVKGRGLVNLGWAPQVSILSHPATRGFLTHSGFSSVVEALGFGRVLVLMPLINDQPLVARLLEEEKVGLPIQRRERDGWALARGEVSEAVRVAMVAEEGAALRDKAQEMKRRIRNEELNDRYLLDLISQIGQRVEKNSG